jgi:hypothetical protein
MVDIAGNPRNLWPTPYMFTSNRDSKSEYNNTLKSLVDLMTEPAIKKIIIYSILRSECKNPRLTCKMVFVINRPDSRAVKTIIQNNRKYFIKRVLRVIFFRASCIKKILVKKTT